MKKILFLLFVAITLVSCNKNKEDEETIDDVSFVNGSYMEGFYTPIAMNLEDIYLNESVRGIEIQFVTEKYYFIPEIEYTKDISEEDKIIFNKYVDYYGDKTSNEKHYSHILDKFGCKYPIEKISIVVDKDFDSNHPAGSELNDLLRFRTNKNYIGIIENGYDNNYSYKICYANEISNYKLINEKFTLEIPQNPSDKGYYTFVVKINFLPDPVTGLKCEPIIQAVTIKF